MVAHESGLSHPTVALDPWARRIVSEDSIHSIAPLPTTIHPFPESKNLVVVKIAQTAGRVKKRHCASPQPIAPSLLPHDRKPIEERDDLGSELRKSVDLPIPAMISRLSQRPTP